MEREGAPLGVVSLWLSYGFSPDRGRSWDGGRPLETGGMQFGVGSMRGGAARSSRPRWRGRVAERRCDTIVVEVDVEAEAEVEVGVIIIVVIDCRGEGRVMSRSGWRRGNGGRLWCWYVSARETITGAVSS